MSIILTILTWELLLISAFVVNKNTRIWIAFILVTVFTRIWGFTTFTCIYTLLGWHFQFVNLSLGFLSFIIYKHIYRQHLILYLEIPFSMIKKLPARGFSRASTFVLINVLLLKFSLVGFFTSLIKGCSYKWKTTIFSAVFHKILDLQCIFEYPYLLYPEPHTGV